MPEQTNRVIGELVEFSSQLGASISNNILDNLLITTPVDTGFAASNWVQSLDTPFEGTAGTRAEAEAGRINTAPQSAGRSSIASYLIGRDAWLVNNVEYILELNAGSSRQAPSNFVEAAIIRGVREVRA